MTFLVQQTLIYAVPLMIVALAGVFAERSGIINLALEGIMIFGAFIGVLFVRLMQGSAAVLAAQQTNMRFLPRTGPDLLRPGSAFFLSVCPGTPLLKRRSAPSRQDLPLF